MYNVLKNYLEHAAYTEEDAKHRIDYAVARGHITLEQATELDAIAKARGTDVTLASRVNALEKIMGDLVREEIVPSDKLGCNWKNVYVQGILVRQEYIMANTICAEENTL